MFLELSCPVSSQLADALELLDVELCRTQSYTYIALCLARVLVYIFRFILSFMFVEHLFVPYSLLQAVRNNVEMIHRLAFRAIQLNYFRHTCF
jgi:hypothetical protein